MIDSFSLLDKLPGRSLWGPYLEQSPVSWEALADEPFAVLREFLPDSLTGLLRESLTGYAEVLLFLLLAGLVVSSVPRPGAGEGLRFLFGIDPARLRGSGLERPAGSCAAFLRKDRRVAAVSDGFPSGLCGCPCHGRRDCRWKCGRGRFSGCALRAGAVPLCRSAASP